FSSLPTRRPPRSSPFPYTTLFRSSLSREEADGQRLLALVRGPWGIENRRHDVQEVPLGEDRCRVRTGSSPEVRAVVRDVAVHRLDRKSTPLNSSHSPISYALFSFQ